MNRHVVKKGDRFRDVSGYSPNLGTVEALEDRDADSLGRGVRCLSSVGTEGRFSLRLKDWTRLPREPEAKPVVRAGQVWKYNESEDILAGEERTLRLTSVVGKSRLFDRDGECRNTLTAEEIVASMTLVRDVEDTPVAPSLDSHAADLAREEAQKRHAKIAASRDRGMAGMMAVVNERYATRCAEDRHREAIKAKLAPGYEARMGSVMGWDKRGRR